MRTSDRGGQRPATVEELIKQSSDVLRRALVVRFGIEIGLEVHADAVAYAWEHGQRLLAMANPTGYLYRVAQSSARRQLRWRRHVDVEAPNDAPAPTFTPELQPALRRLRPRQRVAVVLVHGYGFSYAEVGAILDEPASSVRNHVHRGLAGLRKQLHMEDPS